MKILELFTDTDGTLSHTKSSAVMANVAATVAFLHHSLSNGLSEGLLVAFVATVGLQRYGSKYLDIKHKTKKEES